ncbi:serine/threonine protein kinase, partial [Acinetobacter sp. LH3_13]|uniref:serine/threonine protein kinase n=1 Tax=Acinetobacter sp. LH3_13 TaxID=3434463 RepID=UPI003EC07FF8
LISRTGDVKLTDFGLARQLDAVTMTKSGLLAGSIGYMAPEMLDGERTTALSDVFSFGAVAYELLAGENPFAAPSPQAMMKKMMHGQFRPLCELVP